MPGILPHLVQSNNVYTKDQIVELIKKMPVDLVNRVVEHCCQFMKDENGDPLIINHHPAECLNILSKCEEYGLRDVVIDLLLNRVLYYVDQEQEYLYPYVYELMVKYNIPLYQELLEENKPQKIIDYYQANPEVDGAQWLISHLTENNTELHDQVDLIG